MIIQNFNTDENIFLIAEIGNNHEGDFNIALKMISKAKKAGADAVKFQTIIPEELISYDQTDRLAILNKFKFSREQFAQLATHAKDLDIIFFSTPFDLSTAHYLNTVQDVFKIASSDNNFWPLIDLVGRFNKPCLISTGCMDMNDVRKLVEKWSGLKKNLGILHCVSAYPVPENEASLGSIAALKNEFPDLTIGYSDHTLGIEAPQIAAQLGARIIEKHFTLDHNYSSFRDHQLSADPKELKQLGDALKGEAYSHIAMNDELIGNVAKQVQPCEIDTSVAIRRSICANKDLSANHRITPDDLSWVRPGTGIAPGDEDLIIGKVINSAYKRGQIFKLDDLN